MARPSLDSTPYVPQHLFGGNKNDEHSGRIEEVAAYCESDVINTYRLWLIHELFCGRLSKENYEASEVALQEKIRARDVRHAEVTAEADPAANSTHSDPAVVTGDQDGDG